MKLWEKVNIKMEQTEQRVKLNDWKETKWTANWVFHGKKKLKLYIMSLTNLGTP